jgi:hypothetical protein
VEAPDTLVFGLTARQAAILATAAAAGYLVWQALGGRLPAPALAALLVPLAAAAVVLALGRRDGLGLDVWLLAALGHRRRPRRAAAAPEGILAVPGWAPAPAGGREDRAGRPGAPRPAVLRLPAQAISADGVVDLGGRAAALVGVTTVNLGLRSAVEQAALVDAFGRWLNALTGPVQLVVSAQRVDLAGHAARVAEAAQTLPHPAVADAALDYAQFLADLARGRDPLWRTVTLACAAAGERAAAEVIRRAEHAAAAMAAIGAQAGVLDGPTATAVLTAAVDPYQPTDASWPRALPGVPVAATAGHAEDRAAAGTRTRPAVEAAQPRDAGWSLVGTVGPASVENAPGHLRVGDGYAATLGVTGYPAEVGPAWLDPLLSWPGRLDVALHIEPVPTVVAADRLRRQRARLESTRRLDADKGRLADPAVDAAADDAVELADRLPRGQARLYRVGVYLTVHAPTHEELAEAVADVRAAAASVLLDTQPATWRQLQGWTSTLPLATDSLRMRHVFDTDALAAAFPLASADLPAPLPGQGAPAGGVLFGVNTASNGVVWWDRWAQDNHNSVVLARSGAGKSYLVKLEVLRCLYDGVQVAVIDPEDEYGRLADAVGGAVLALGAPGVKVNPLEVPAADRRPDALTRRALFLHTLIAVLLGEAPPPAERAALDRAIAAAYAAAGISNDPATWARPAPLLRDLAAALADHVNPAAGTLAARLSPWTEGSFRHLFDGPTTYRPRGHLVVWSTRQLADELRAPGMLLALDAIWRDVDNSSSSSSTTTTTTRAGVDGADGLGGSVGPRRLVVVDEAWTLRDGEGARFLHRLAKAARKRRAGLAVVTQDAADLLSTDLGQAVVANAATQILMRQAPQAIDLIADTFALTAGEARMLQAAGRRRPAGRRTGRDGQERRGRRCCGCPRRPSPRTWWSISATAPRRWWA